MLYNQPMKNTETIFFAVTGMSPAIITETVWALAHEKPAVIPDRIVVLTTRRGADQIRQELFSSVKKLDSLSPWDALIAELQKAKLPVKGKLRFGDTANDIRIFTTYDSLRNRTIELEDIRTPAENAAVADFILEKLRAFTDNPETRIIASIAGGRKTMGALLYACMTLVGRETDRLTHVLVNDPYDNPGLSPKFYFPLKSMLTKVKPAIELAEVPFVPLRNKFAELSDMPGNFSRLVSRYSNQLRRENSKPAQISLDEGNSSIQIDGTGVRLRPRAFMMLRYLVHINSKPGLIPIGQPEAVEPMKAFLGSSSECDWVQSADDIKRELSEIRKQFTRAGLSWMPGIRRDSLKLPPFLMKK